MSHIPETILKTKATLLSGATIKLPIDASMDCSDIKAELSVYTDNHHGNPWIFFKLGETSRVRMTVYDQFATFQLVKSDKLHNAFKITDISSNVTIADNVIIEKALVHCPKQLFLGLYEYCSTGCLFCPITYKKEPICYTLDDIMSDINLYEKEGFESIGITTGVPPGISFDEVGMQLANVVKQIRHRIGSNIPIGVSAKHPTKAIIYELKNAGADEIRLNLEIYNYDLAAKLMPNKKIDDILRSIEHACQIFGRGKVSSNLIAGIGESDEDIISGVTVLTKLGAVSTIYPYDPIPERDKLLRKMSNGEVGIPTAARLIRLAVEHKAILNANSLKSQLLTMCPACAASHIMPGKDL